MRPTEEEIIKSVETANQLIDGLPEPRRSLVKKMMEGQVGKSYFTAPASSRENFHSCFPGGLVVHSLNVVKTMFGLVKTLCPGMYDLPTIAFVGMFHDLGKTGDGVNDFYVPNPSDWHREHGILYEVNKDCLDMPNSERGLYILQNHGIVVSSDEYFAIRLNDGAYAEENRAYGLPRSKLALLTHWADSWATATEKSTS